MSRSKKWVILLPIAIGIGILLLFKQNSSTPVRSEPEEQATSVNTITAPMVTVLPKAIGQGSVRPTRTWSAIAQVKGNVITKHPMLEKGRILQHGTALIEIDPTDYQLAIAQTEADIKGIEAQLAELDVQAANSEASLKIEESALELNQKELERKRRLTSQGSVSRSDLDTQERNLLAQRQSVQGHRNTLNRIPSQRNLLQAQLLHKQATLQAAQRDLDFTRITLPFTSRIANVEVELQQYVREGELLLTADALDSAEIEIPLTINEIAALLHSSREIDVFNRDQENFPLPGDIISAEVRLQENGIQASWPAKFERLSDTLDPKTRTVGVIVQVDDPYAKVQPGKRPPLVKGLFVEVELTGKARPERIVIPRSALHGHRVYVMNADSRLEIRPVQIELIQPEFAVIAEGLEAGDAVITTDLLPAIEGMLLKSEPDSTALDNLLQAASGQRP